MCDKEGSVCCASLTTMASKSHLKKRPPKKYIKKNKKKNGTNKLCNKNPNLISLEILQVNFIKFQFESVTVIAKLRNESFT